MEHSMLTVAALKRNCATLTKMNNGMRDLLTVISTVKNTEDQAKLLSTYRDLFNDFKELVNTTGEIISSLEGNMEKGAKK